MDVQGKHTEQLHKLQRFAESMLHDHMVVVESSEFKLSAIQQELDTINKKLTVLIKLLRQTIGQDNKPSEMQRREPSGNQQGNTPKINMSRSAPDMEMFK